MDVMRLKNEFYQCIREALVEFSKTENNRDVYVMSLDCDSSVGGVYLRYNNRARFQEHLSEYEKYFKEYGTSWEVYGLHGSEYQPGEFAFIEYNETKLVKHFLSSYYYHSVGDYFGDGEPIEDIAEDYEDIFWSMVEETINKLKNEIKEIGIHAEKDFIFFYCDHDQSHEELDEMICKTVDKKLMEELINKSA